MDLAVIKTGGKQYKVKKGQTIKIEKVDKKIGDGIEFETLLKTNEDGKEVKIGKPSLGKLVKGKILEQGRDKKVKVVKYKSKTRYKKTYGHHQLFSKAQILEI